MANSFITIGGNSLLIACTELLLEHGHRVEGVITSAPIVSQWARQRSLEVLDANGEYASQLSRKPFDYFVSIAHLNIIPTSVLALPRRGAINFHDGLLPEYAGLNVPVWAILHGEPRHGVTWHIMTEQADAGDILKQHEFEVAATETALSLNTKCFEAGMESFAELLKDLESGSEKRTPQDMTRRRYFGRSARPAAACLLNWTQPAAVLNALVRATSFGNYPNPVGAAKLLARGVAYVVADSGFRGDDCPEVPGTIVEVDDQQLVVATGSGTIAIRGLALLGGQPVSIADFQLATGLNKGDQLDALSDERYAQLTKLGKQLAKSESTWTQRLEQFTPVDCFNGATDANAPSELALVDLSLPPSFASRFCESLDNALLAALGAYLAVTTDRGQIDLAFETALDADRASTDSLVSYRLPVRLQFDLSRGFDAAVDEVGLERQRLEGKGGWLRDLIARTPELKSKPELSAGQLDAVGMQLVTRLSERPGPANWTAPAIVVAATDQACALSFSPRHYSSESMERFADRFNLFLSRLAEDGSVPLAEVGALTKDERQQILVDWNRTTKLYPSNQCVHELFEQQVERTPDAEALVHAGETLTYRELNARANQLAAYLREKGVKADQLIGVNIERSVDMLVASLGVQKAGGAYVPLDPSFPPNRLALMMQDSRAAIIVTQSHLVASLPPTNASIVCIDGDWETIAKHSAENQAADVGSSNLAYVIYTSGSTGRPKGVLVEHRNVVNFFAGMDDCVGVPDDQKVLLAVTSLSFDISVLELLWTLTRGFKVVLYSERVRPKIQLGSGAGTMPMRFGLFYFSSDEGEGSENKYRLLIEGAKFADENGFVSVSTPERHFHAFGGLYPNPAVTGAALATITKNVQIRAGSVVLPLHHPIRVAEDWALVDNLSQGRVGISFASGWQPVDFVIRPETYDDRHKLMYESIETVRKLWRGDRVAFADSKGQMQSIRTLPRPVQKELPVWVTTAGNTETWRSAGAIGANILTHLLGQTVHEIAEKVVVYRSAFQEAGHTGDGTVTLMLHTFVGDDLDQVREIVRKPMIEYLASSMSLVKGVASSWAAFKRKADGTMADTPDDLSALSREEMDDLLAYSFERYFSTSGLFGTPQGCAELVGRLRGAGVNEIACLVDFGVETDTVLQHLSHLNQVRVLCEQDVSIVVPDAVPASGNHTMGALIREHGVTHLQCTPSMAQMMLADTETQESLGELSVLMIGGEAFPVNLAKELSKETNARIINMYGPTETTIWSSTQDIQGNEQVISIGRPIANTQLYILNDHMQPVATGLVGELYIGGDGVVRGYHERPELTAERFVENPFYDAVSEAKPSKRIYRTGDLARYRVDGTVEFLGRVDHQVKFLGYRIELGEIETALTEHPAVREAVVVAREDAAGEKRLVAYYLGDRVLQDSEPREWLRQHLPGYMIPSLFVKLDAFPQTPNRKIDRKALPAPESTITTAAPSPSLGASPPANDMEERVAGIWREVLGITTAGRDDNFFDIGGHSLLAVKAVRILRESLGKEIAITDLFRFPTVSRLAAYLSDDSDQSLLEEGQQRGAARRERLLRSRRRRD